MKHLFFITSFLIGPIAHAATYTCNTTLPAGGGIQPSYSAVVTIADANAKVGTVDVAYHGGMAQFIELILNHASVNVSNEDPTMVFTNVADGFSLSVYQIFYQGEVGFSASMHLNRPGFSPFTQAMTCFYQTPSDL